MDLRFMRGGVAREMGLGAVHTIGLADARQRARNVVGCRSMTSTRSGRKRRRLDARLAAKQMTFREWPKNTSP
jgi:hypothetical protein